MDSKELFARILLFGANEAGDRAVEQYRARRAALSGHKPPHLASLIDPEKEYPVSYAYHQQRGRIEAPASGKMLGKDLTAPQITELYRAGLLNGPPKEAIPA